MFSYKSKYELSCNHHGILLVSSGGMLRSEEDGSGQTGLEPQWSEPTNSTAFNIIMADGLDSMTALLKF